jgi:hypothetical protein
MFVQAAGGAEIEPQALRGPPESVDSPIRSLFIGAEAALRNQFSAAC